MLDATGSHSTSSGDSQDSRQVAASSPHPDNRIHSIGLVGNPNCGKTSLFNRMTGARQKVGNYAGVTVEKKEGLLTLSSGQRIRVLDLPGAYSLESTSPDEEITREICLGELPDSNPEVLVCVADSTNLRLNLHLVLEIHRLGRPMILVLNMFDDAMRRGIKIDVDRLQKILGIPVIPTVALNQKGIEGLLHQLEQPVPPPPDPDSFSGNLHHAINRILDETVYMPAHTDARDDRLDKIFLNRYLGLPILALILFVVFQAVFSWASPFQTLIENAFSALGNWVAPYIHSAALRGLVVDGIIAGVGGVLVFLPQILWLFFFILILEESGYLPRAAFLLDQVMHKCGLSGRSFIPLLSSFACAIPGVLGTRTISDRGDRLTTILIAPLMTCSARLPVYTLLIGAFIPQKTVAGFINLQGLVLFGLYVAGIVSALIIAKISQLVVKYKSDHTLIMQLPSYRLPAAQSVALGLYERGKAFIERVGTVILALSILIWFLSSYPKAPAGATLPAIDYSFAGKLGHFIQPLFAPIGFNWEICVALIPGMAAREVVVSALSTVYSVSGDEEQVSHQLDSIISSQWSMATAAACLAWFVFAPQCISTLATVKRETGSWKFTAFMTAYLFVLAYLAAFVTYRVVTHFS